MNQITWKISYNYTLMDLLRIMGVGLNNWYGGIVDVVNKQFGTSFESDDSEFSRALGGYLCNSKCILFSSENPDITTEDEELDYKLVNIVAKYDSLINDYKSYYNALSTELTTLKNKTTTKFNDTPTEEGDYSTDIYTSTITTTESEVDYAIGDKISLLSKKMRHLVDEFVKEFEGYVIWIN